MDDKDKREILAKNLEYVSNTYNATEQIFPIWEAAFALIVGQLLIAYFDPAACRDQQKWITIVGSLISLIWLILVSLNLQHALSMNKILRSLEMRLNSSAIPNEFLSPWQQNVNESWTLLDIIIGKSNEEGVVDALIKASRSTWFYRRSLPFALLVIWLYWAYNLDKTVGVYLIYAILIMITWFNLRKIRAAWAKFKGL